MIDLIKSKILKDSALSNSVENFNLPYLAQKRSFRLLAKIEFISENNPESFESLIHNTIAESSIVELELLSVHLQFWKNKSKLKLSVAMSSLIKTIKIRSSVALVLNWLVLNDKIPTKKSIEEVSSNDIKYFFLLSLLRINELNVGNKNQVALLIRRTNQIFGKILLKKLLVDSDITKEFPKLTLESFRGLSIEVQISLSSDKKIIDNILNAHTARQLNKYPYQDLLTPEGIKLSEFFKQWLLPFIAEKDQKPYEYYQFKNYSKKQIKGYLELVYLDPKYYKLFKNALLSHNVSEQFFRSGLAWQLLADRRCRLTYLKNLSDHDRSNIWEKLPNSYIAQLFAECKNTETLIYFIENKYLKKVIRRELLVYRYYGSFDKNYKKVLCDAIYSKITVDELLFLFKKSSGRLWELESAVYESKAFSNFIDKCLIEANGSDTYPFEELLSFITSFGSVQNMQSLMHVEVSSGKKFWEVSCERKRYKSKYWELIRTNAPELKERFFKMEALISLKNKAFLKNLKEVLSGKCIPSVLKLQKGSYPYLIPYVQKTFRKQPLRAIAYELALCFSIQDASYLLYLCALRAKNRDSNKPGYHFDKLYHTHKLPKKSGGNRLITAPEARLKGLQKKFLKDIFEPLPVHDCVHGFKQGRSILTNAAAHVGQRCVVNIDIQSFFPSTNYKEILKVCWKSHSGISVPASYVLADICSYAGGLPMGAPTSPAIANLVLRKADHLIASRCARYGVNYTRYADDLTFSGNGHPVKMIPYVEKVLSGFDYKLDPKKTNIFRRGRRQMVTGLVVNEKPNIPRRIRKRLRAAVHKKSLGEAVHWHGKPMSEESLMGHLNWLQSVQSDEAVRYKEILHKA